MMKLTRRRCLGLGIALLGALAASGARWDPTVAGTTEGTPAPAASPKASPGADPWQELHRPLKLPVLAAGAPCPRTGGRIIDPAIALAAGAGPAYAVGLGRDGVLSLQRTATADGWYGAKILWVAGPAYRGPVLLHGGRLGGSGELRFGAAAGSGPQPELRLPAGDTATPSSAEAMPQNAPPGWSFWPSHAYVRAAGCYAFQVDGTDFSEVIVFTARTPREP